jgi:hypothetical protein
MNPNMYKTRFHGASTLHKNTRTRLFSRTSLRFLFLGAGILALLISGWSMFAAPAPPSNPAISLDQASNGGIGKTPIDPVGWENGNQNGQKAHYLEGQSIPYRARITGLTAGQTYKATFGYDIKHSGGHAIDYITSRQRIAEEVDPCDGTGETAISPCVEDVTPPAIPAPSPGSSPPDSSTTVAQKLIAYNSFNSLVGFEGAQVVSAFNADATLVEFVTQGDPVLSQSETSFKVTFTANSSTVVLSWGGHIARAADWANDGGSATTINGSPYHTRAKTLEVPNGSGGFNTISIGNQDRALASSAVQAPSACTLTNNGIRVCTSGTTTHELFGPADTSATYSFSFLSGTGNIDASNTNPSSAGCTDADATTPCIYATVTATATYTLRLTVTNAAGSEFCDATVTVDQAPSAAAGDDQQRCNTGAPSDKDFAVSGSGTLPTGGTHTWSILAGGTTTATIADASAFNTTITLGGNGTVTARLTVTGPTGTSCTNATDDVVLTLNESPTVTITLENICDAGTADLKANPSGGSGAYTYQWSVGGAPIQNATNQTLHVTALGTYSVTVTDGQTGGDRCSGSATKKLCFLLQDAP